MYLSYSGRKLFRECAQAYWHRYIAKTVPPDAQNRTTMLYGSVVGTLFELFYNDRIWTQKGSEAALQALVEKTLDDTIARETQKGGTIIWDDPKLNPKTRYRSRDDLVADIRASIPRGLATIRHHRFLGKEAQAEVKLDSTVQGHMLGGRADFIIRRIKPYEDLIILDGKGSKWRAAYTDNHQLFWYAMLYRIRYGAPPDKVGFLFWRCDPIEAVDWITFTARDLDELQEQTLLDIAKIEDGASKLATLSEGMPQRQRLWETFPPSPTPQRCRLCDYLLVCQDGKNIVSDRLQAPDTGGGGVEDIGL